MVISTYCQECKVNVAMSQKNHQRVVHQQSVQVTYQDSAFEVVQRRGETGEFHCPCGQFASPNPNSIRQHTQGHNQLHNKTANVNITAAPVEVDSLQHGMRSQELKRIAGLSMICYSESSLTTTATEINSITYNSEFNVLICLTCEIGIPPKVFAHHIRSVHQQKQYSKSWLNNMISSKWPDAVSNVSLEIRDPIPAIPHIAIHSGYKCLSVTCWFTARSLGTMKKHNHQKHQNQYQFRQCFIQTLFSSTHSAYFEITVPKESINPRTNLKGNQKLDADVEHLLQLDGEAELSLLNTRHLVTNDNVVKNDSPWLHMTGWKQHLCGVDLKHACEQLKLPAPSAEGKHELKLMFESFHRVFDPLYRATDHVPTNIKEQVMSVKEHEPSGIPFSPVQERSTWARYVRFWKQLLSYLFHCVNMLASDDESGNALRRCLQHCLQGEILDDVKSWHEAVMHDSRLDDSTRDERLKIILLQLISQP
jgi:hypothetical protein